jgi:DNA-binding SARP family transcriptional activator
MPLSTGSIRLRILGRLELEVQGRLVQVPSGRQREMLAILAMSVGQAVPVETIARALWGDRASRTSRATVHTVAFRLRRVIGADMLVTAADGYVLQVPEDSIDLFHFRALVREARSLARPGMPDPELALLKEALALWRDEPFIDLRSDWLQRSVVPQLLEEWFSALERRLDLELASGRHSDLLGELRSLVARYPLRENLWARLILALYRSGRQAEGFAAYLTVAAMLREEYGADPSEELNRAYQLMLHGGSEHLGEGPDSGDGTDSGRAAQVLGGGAGRPSGRLSTLPRDLETFSARSKELVELLTAGDTSGSGPAVVCVLEGMAGVGKTTLAVRAAHCLADRFPDGQVYLDLRAHTSGQPPLTTGSALAQLLVALGVDRRQVPADEEETAALWRTVLADRRVLLVLDNVVDSAHVRPLLPGGGACMAIITSRRRLAGLDGARVVQVGLPSEDEAGRLFVRVSERPALAVDDPDVAEVVRLCGRLPLALTVAAARLRHRAAWTVADLAARLRDQRSRVDELRAEDRSVASVFALSVDQLPDRHRELLVLASLFIRNSMDRYAGAALIGVPVEVAEAMLEELTDAHLVEEPTAGRYQLHDLFRVYCREQLGRDTPETGRATAAYRLLSYYVNAVDAVDQLLRPQVDSGRFLIAEPPLRRTFDGLADALEWCAIEHGNLVAAVEIAAERDEHELTWQLACLLWAYLDRGGHRADMIQTHQLGFAAARAVGHHQAETHTLNGLGLVYQDIGQYERSLEYLHECLARSREYGLESMTLSALNNIGTTHGKKGDHEDAIDFFKQVADRAGDLQKRAGALGNLGEVYRRAGDLAAALEYGQRAWELIVQTDDPHGAAMKRLNLAETCRLTGDLDSAIDHAAAALAVFRDGGDRVAAGEALTYLGSALHQRGDLDEARRAWLEALEILQQIGAPEADDVRRYLAGVTDAISVPRP